MNILYTSSSCKGNEHLFAEVEKFGQSLNSREDCNSVGSYTNCSQVCIKELIAQLTHNYKNEHKGGKVQENHKWRA